MCYIISPVGVDGFAGFTRQLQIVVSCLVKTLLKIHRIMLFGRWRLSFVGWYKVKHLANNDLSQKRIRSLQHPEGFNWSSVPVRADKTHLCDWRNYDSFFHVTLVQIKKCCKQICGRLQFGFSKNACEADLDIVLNDK